MDENTTGTPAPGRPDPGPAMLITIGVFCVALVCLGIGFYAGRATAPKPDVAADGCSATRSTLDRLVQEGKTASPGDPQSAGSQWLLTASNVVLQNPGCFDAKTRAAAQTVKDQVASNENSAAASDAADRITQCLSRIDVGFGC
ncbi:hypothetical protein ACH40F_07610 [Streptomyces sp. NPDC020794]|uniref:hypothetical protein n=1 Tax=unclassified Streptomyces TaxID=2593676 RepID=UPI0036E6B5E3